jgi:tetratricopeptide (TPR) repeat protein
MSRSIHANRRTYLDEKRLDYSDKWLHRARLAEIARASRKKRRIKTLVSEERRRPEMPAMTPVSPDTVSILLVDDDEHIFFPASPEDFRRVLQLLPQGVLDGVSEIRLHSGQAEFDEDAGQAERRTGQRDPWLGRLGSEIIPGVFAGPYLGVYIRSTSAIEIYAYVRDPSEEWSPALDFFLRLVMIETFIHEIAHHDDRMRRIASGRWRFDNVTKKEHYAETAAAAWLDKNAIPYLVDTYPEGAAALHEWVHDHTGTTFPLRDLATNWHWGANALPIPLQEFSVYFALTDLAFDLRDGVPRLDARVNLARELHFAEVYDKALEVLDSVLREDPASLEAKTLVSDIYEHQCRYEDAESMAIDLLSAAPDSVDVWWVLCQVYESRQEWNRLVEATAQYLARHTSFDVLDSQTRAFLELGDDEAFEANLQEFVDRGEAVAVARFRALKILRSGGPEEALRCAEKWLRRNIAPYDRAVFAAIRFEAAHRLGSRRFIRALDAESIAKLRLTKYGPWVDRLASEFGLRT